MRTIAIIDDSTLVAGRLTTRCRESKGQDQVGDGF